ncbi:MAG: OmpA family protein, partial [Terriglobales bacterium]
AQQAANEAEQQRQEAVRQKEEMRQRLLAQLNQVLQTRDSARGLIVSMPDVLFAFNQHTLKPEARERLARISGIVLAYPDLKLEIDGYTDAIGSDDYNQTLSDKRAEAVRDYLVNSGVSMNNVVARGLGKSDPVADNSTAAGRQLNRRVEMIVSGDVIGTQLGPNTHGAQAQSIEVNHQ